MDYEGDGEVVKVNAKGGEGGSPYIINKSNVNMSYIDMRDAH